MKHKHSEVLHAFADGIECETWYGDKWVKTTDLFEFDHFEKIRIKPEPKPDKIRYYNISNFGSIHEHDYLESCDIKIICDGETLNVKSIEYGDEKNKYNLEDQFETRTINDFWEYNIHLDEEGKTGFMFSDPPYGGFIGSIDMLKWLVKNRAGDYFERLTELNLKNGDKIWNL